MKDLNAYSRDINEIDKIISAHIASNVSSVQFETIRKEFLEGFEIGWKFTKAESGKPNSKFFLKIKNRQVITYSEFDLGHKPRECGMAFGIVVSSLRNNPYYIFAEPVSVKVYRDFFEFIAKQKSYFNKFLLNVVTELQRMANSVSKDWNEEQKSKYIRFLRDLREIIS